MPSSGWKKCEIVCSSSRRSRGALRYQAVLASATVYRLISPGGNETGTPARVRGWYASALPWAAGGRSSRRAKSPLVITERPRRAPRARLSDQASV